jgi:hypothetical protein
MRRIRDLLGLFLLLHAGFSGCAHTEPQIKPPKPPEEFNAPPDNDPRYNKPIEYPAETMDQDPLQKKTKDGKNTPGPTGSPRAPTRPGAGF